jgi:hypothetical protein
MKIILILTCLNSLFNTPIKIKVVDKNSGNPIAFVGYTRISDHKGSYSDESGNIEFESGLNEKYTLSCIGYHSDTIVPSKSSEMVFLNPKIIELKEFEVYKNRNIEKEIDIGYSKKGVSFKPFYSILSRKMAVCTYIPKENKNETWLISEIKIDLGAAKSNDYEAFLIRLFIKEKDNKLPGRDLLTKDYIVKIMPIPKDLVIH